MLFFDTHCVTRCTNETGQFIAGREFNFLTGGGIWAKYWNCQRIVQRDI